LKLPRNPHRTDINFFSFQFEVNILWFICRNPFYVKNWKIWCKVINFRYNTASITLCTHSISCALLEFSKFASISKTNSSSRNLVFLIFCIKNKKILGFGGNYSFINKKKFPQKNGEIIFISRFCQNVSFSTCDFNIFPLLWSERSGPKFKFFQLFKDFYVNTRPACSILGKKMHFNFGFWEQAILCMFYLLARAQYN